MHGTLPLSSELVVGQIPKPKYPHFQLDPFFPQSLPTLPYKVIIILAKFYHFSAFKYLELVN